MYYTMAAVFTFCTAVTKLMSCMKLPVPINILCTNRSVHFLQLEMCTNTMKVRAKSMFCCAVAVDLYKTNYTYHY